MVMKQVSLLKFSNLMLVLCLLTSCGRGICPGFPSDQEDWAPYAIGDTIQLYNEATGLKMALPIDYFFITKEQDALSYPYNTPCFGPDLTFVSSIDSVNLVSISVQLSVQSTKDIHAFDGIDDVSVALYNYENNSESGIVQIGETELFYLNDKSNYDSEQFTITMENPQSKRFNKIILAKGLGILQLEETNGTIWKKAK